MDIAIAAHATENVTAMPHMMIAVKALISFLPLREDPSSLRRNLGAVLP